MARSWLDKAVVAVLFLFVGAGLSRLFDGGEHEPDGSFERPAVTRVDSIPGRVKQPSGYFDKVTQAAKVRQVDPEVVYNAPSSSRSRQSGYVTTTTSAGDTVEVAINNLEQVTYGDGSLQVFTHNRTADARYDFPVGKRSPFTLYMDNGTPKVQVPRCYVCDPELTAEVGYGFAKDYESPYVAAEASVAVLSRSARLFVRPEVGAVNQFKLGVRWVF